MATFEFSVHGVGDVQGALGRSVAEAKQIADRVAEALAEEAARQIRLRVPKDTRRLNDSIRTEKVTDGHWQVLEGAVVVRDLYVGYHHYVEFGTRHQSAQPHFYPGVAATITEGHRIAREAVLRK